MKIVALDTKYKVVEFMEGMNDLSDFLSRFNKLEDIILPYDKVKELGINLNEYKVLNYYDDIAEKFYDELSYNEFKIIEEKNEFIKNKFMNVNISQDDNKSYKDFYNDLDSTICEFLEKEAYDDMEKYYVTLGVQGRNINIGFDANICNALLDMVREVYELDNGVDIREV